MKHKGVPLKHNDYTVGWISALPLEKAAAIAMLDEVHPWKLPQNPNDHNTYNLGTIYGHNVVLACLPAGVYGTTSAAVLATQMLFTFPSIRVGLMVGIGGGAPSAKVDLRLGDIVVSKPKNTSGGVIQYDHGKKGAGGSFHQTGTLNKPPPVLLTAIAKLQAQATRVKEDLRDTFSSMESQYPEMSYPGQEHDTLYAPEYNHAGSDKTCSQCDRTQLLSRPARATNDPEIHYGLIASGNQVMKHAITRDRLARELDVICFEMEAAGLMDHFPCLVIRGICDYADSHKNDKWQRYAAATAAAYAKQLLCTIPVPQIAQTVTIPEILSEAVASLASSLLEFISIGNLITTRVLEARSPSIAVFKVLTEVAKQLPLMIKVMERLQKDCRADSSTGVLPNSLLSAVEGGLEQITILDRLIHETLPTPTDSTLCRLRKSLAMYRKRKDMMDILKSLDEYKGTLTLYLAERHAVLLETVNWQNKKAQCHKWLSPCDIVCDQTPRLSGTCQWIWAEQAFLEWMRPLPDTARLLCIYGIHGCGKSVLANSIATDLDSRGERTLFFSFSGSDGERQTLDSLARSLLWQLFDIISSQQAFEILDGLQQRRSREPMMLFQALAELAKLVTFPVFCIIDGIDECTGARNDPEQDLLSPILDLVNLPNFHVAPVGRRYALEAAIAATPLKIEVTPSLVRTDIERFIQHKLKDWEFLPLADSLNVTEVLRDNSDGMFLWVKLMVNELRKSASIAEVTERLRNLPCRLEKLYKDIFTRLVQNLD